LKRRSAQEAGREIRAVLAKIAERLDQETIHDARPQL
jgi:chromosome partitioning protein